MNLVRCLAGQGAVMGTVPVQLEKVLTGIIAELRRRGFDADISDMLVYRD